MPFWKTKMARKPINEKRAFVPAVQGLYRLPGAAVMIHIKQFKA